MVEMLRDDWPQLLSGLWTTIWLSILGLTFGSSVGFVLGVLRALRLPPTLFPAIDLYIHLIRGTPFLVQLYLVYYVAPRTGLPLLNLSATAAAILALTLYAGSYSTEITRSAIASIQIGQIDGAKALGLTRLQTLRLVVLPQALRLMLPPLGNVYVAIIKSTSVVSVVGISELVRSGENIALRQPANVLPAYLCVAALYFMFCWPLLRLVQAAGRHSQSRRIDMRGAPV